MAVLVLLLAPVAHAGPFDPPPAEPFQGAAPGARARFAESLALLGEAVAKDPGDAAAWRRAADLLGRFNRATELTPLVRKELEKEHPPAVQAALRGTLGHLLLIEARRFGFRGVIVFGPGLRQRQPMQLPPQAIKLLEEARRHLEAALADDTESIEIREDLADVLERLDEENNKEESGGCASRPARCACARS
jgi:tetratricopeptide (TPR) repeat protein